MIKFFKYKTHIYYKKNMKSFKALHRHFSRLMNPGICKLLEIKQLYIKFNGRVGVKPFMALGAIN